MVCSMTWSWCMGKNSLVDLRHDCAKRFRLPDLDEEEEQMDTACCCVPLRTAVFVVSLFSTFSAVLAFLGYTEQRFSGGYCLTSATVVGAMQVCGAFFGPVGMMGAFELNVNFLKTYNYFQFCRMAGMVIMFYTDIPLLSDCNTWRTDINEAIKMHGWNPALYNVAMGNGCLQAQSDFLLGGVLSAVIYMYLISLTRRLIWDTEFTPRYLLAMPHECPSGAFTQFSRTQGKSKPPYGALLGYDVTSQKGKFAFEKNNLVGQPVAALTGTQPAYGAAQQGMQQGAAQPGYRF